MKPNTYTHKHKITKFGDTFSKIFIRLRHGSVHMMRTMSATSIIVLHVLQFLLLNK